MAKKELNIQEKDVTILHEEKGEKMGTVLRILRYVVNGKPGDMILEKRGMFGEKKGRRMGLNHNDMKTILLNREKIMNLLDLKR